MRSVVLGRRTYRPPGLLASIMANDESSTLDPNALAEVVKLNDMRWRSSLQDVIVFLLPCAKMSELRRTLLLPDIHAKGGVVTKDPSEATHCVISMPFDLATNLLNTYVRNTGQFHISTYQTLSCFSKMPFL